MLFVKSCQQQQKEQQQQNFATIRVDNSKKLDKLNLRDILKLEFLKIMHYKQAYTIIDVS